MLTIILFCKSILSLKLQQQTAFAILFSMSWPIFEPSYSDKMMDKNLLKVNDHRRTMALLCLKTKKHLNEIWPLIKSQPLLRGIVIVYSCFEKGCRRKCTRQSRKVLWVGFEFTVLERNLKEWYERPWTMFPSAKAKQQK